jgi:hydroxymethylpyrimidine/phosphomethylpyrimidine kinase
VVKGGHPVADSDDEAIDVVWDGTTTYELRAPRVATPNNHGTGCTFSAAATAALAHGAGIREALDTAKAYVSRAVHSGASWRLGKGRGPLDHFVGRHGVDADPVNVP